MTTPAAPGPRRLVRTATRSAQLAQVAQVAQLAQLAQLAQVAVGALGAWWIVAATPVFAQPSTDSLLDRAARNVASARPIRASFEQTLTNPDIHETKTSHGEFAQQGALRFAFRFSDPPGDAIVADGTWLWVYLPSSARGQALKIPIAQGAQLDLLTQLLTAPRASYTIATRPPTNLDGAPVVVVQLTPRITGTPFTRATIWLDPTDALVRQLEAVETSGLIRRIRFRDIKTDADLPKDALAFVVPSNVKVIDASTLLGGKPLVARP